MYKISIIVPTFNVEKYIKRCFDSLVRQSIGFSNIQVIFVDDCSYDNTCEIIDNYAKDYENVISIHLQENSGAAGKPRNEGMKFAFAEYLLFLDSDDFLMDNACEVLYNKIIESDVDIVVAGYKKQDWIAYWKSELNESESLIENTKNNVSILLNPPGLAAKLFKREFLIKNDITFVEKLPAQDLIFLTESYLKANSILSLNTFIAFEYCVRQEDNDISITQNITKKYLYSLLEAYAIIFDLLEEYCIDNRLKKLYFTKNHFNFLRVQIKQSNLNENELSALFSSENFLKIRNQQFVLEDDELNKFFSQLIENPSDVGGKILQNICKKTREEFINSKEHISETRYIINENKMPETNEIYSIEKELYSFIKRNAKLYNSAEDSKKINRDLLIKYSI